MKKKLNVKLTIAVVSLFIGLLIIGLSHGNNIAVGLGLCFLALSLVFVVLNNTIAVGQDLTEYDKTLAELNAELDSLVEDVSDEAIARMQEIDEITTAICKQRKNKTHGKTRIKILFFVLSAFLVLAGVLLIFS